MPRMARRMVRSTRTHKHNAENEQLTVVSLLVCKILSTHRRDTTSITCRSGARMSKWIAPNAKRFKTNCSRRWVTKARITSPRRARKCKHDWHWIGRRKERKKKDPFCLLPVCLVYNGRGINFFRYRPNAQAPTRCMDCRFHYYAYPQRTARRQSFVRQVGNRG